MTQRHAPSADRTALGIGLIVASVAAMAFADAVVKLVSADMTVWQVFAARSLFAVPLLVILLRVTGAGLRPRRVAWAYGRGMLLVLAWLGYYASLPVLKLSVAAVAVYTGPIMIALFSALLIGEPVTRRQWTGVLLGFLGVLAILKPGSDDFSWYALLPIMGAACYALAMVLTRSHCREEGPLVLSLAVNVCFLAVGLAAIAVLAVLSPGEATVARAPFLLGGWSDLDLWTWGVMAGLGLLLAAYTGGVARAYQIAPPSVIATFDYAYLVSAALWGFVFFAETPGPLTVAGMVLITAAGLLVSVPASAKRPAFDTPAP